MNQVALQARRLYVALPADSQLIYRYWWQQRMSILVQHHQQQHPQLLSVIWTNFSLRSQLWRPLSFMALLLVTALGKLCSYLPQERPGQAICCCCCGWLRRWRFHDSAAFSSQHPSNDYQSLYWRTIDLRRSGEL